MDIRSWLVNSSTKLKKAGIETPRLDCLVLLEDKLHKNRAWVLSRPEYVIDDQALQDLNNKINQRSTHRPLSYIRGRSEFYGREFLVNNYTLVPRPETESMIDAAIKTINKIDKLQIIDVGTGCGALAITAKLELPQAKVIATDIDHNCLRVARHNAKLLGAPNIKFLESDLLLSLITNSKIQAINRCVILANLPYVPDNYIINKAAAHEPHRAIFGGMDGLDIYRSLFKQIEDFNEPPVFIFTEAMPSQHNTLDQIAGKSGYECVDSNDFIQVFKLENL